MRTSVVTVDDLFESILAAYPDASFLQTKIFGEFQKHIPYRGNYWAVAGEEDGVRTAGIVIECTLPFGFRWLWIPYGPLGKGKHFFVELAKIAAQRKVLFARVEPPTDIFEDIKETSPHATVPSPMRYTPEATICIDLLPSEETILAGMKSKGRYNIRVAARCGVHVKKYGVFDDIPCKDFNTFYMLLSATSARDGFSIHPKHYYEDLLRSLCPHMMAAVFFAYAKSGAVVAGLIATYYKETATYFYGASDYGAREMMAPYILHWEVMKNAKVRGFKSYDFFGIAPPGVTNHPWAGVTAFKKKFGGSEKTYPAAFDIIYRPALYWGWRLTKKIRGFF